MFAMYQ